MRKALVSLIATAMLAMSGLAVIGTSSAWAASAAPSGCTTSWASPHDGDWSDFANWTAWNVPGNTLWFSASNFIDTVTGPWSDSETNRFFRVKIYEP